MTGKNRARAGTTAQKRTTADIGDRSGFVERLQALAASVGSVTALARRAGLSQAGVRSYLYESEPTRSVIVAMAEAAGASPGWLVDGKSAMCAPDSPVRQRAEAELRKVYEANGGNASGKAWDEFVRLAGATKVEGVPSWVRFACSTPHEDPAALERGQHREATLGTSAELMAKESALRRLGEFALRAEPAAGWEDMVLPDGQMEQLHEIAAQARHRTRVYEEWGFAARGRRGLGISALFTGESGTGKTMAAEVLAHDLGLELYCIELKSVVSRYVGETAKNLRRLFDTAEEGGAILLFEDVDPVLGNRSQVADSHDSYANSELSYLLQRMESYQGLVILTTNSKSEIDPAFLRRMRFIVEFPFPDATQRREIWRRVFPPATPTEGLGLFRLAKLKIAGGSIRNIALNAAFLASAADEPVRMAHLLRAARAECARLGKRPTADEFEGW